MGEVEKRVSATDFRLPEMERGTLGVDIECCIDKEVEGLGILYALLPIPLLDSAFKLTWRFKGLGMVSEVFKLEDTLEVD